MDIHHVRYFLAVCDTLNFTRAAEACGVTQPALSRAIQQLEDEVGGLLFRRERSLTHITDLARLVKPRFERILDGLGQANRDAQRFLTMADSNLNAGIMCTIGPTRFAGLLAEFQKDHPDVGLKLFEGTASALALRFDAGEIDVAIMAADAELPRHLEAVPLYRERFLVGFPADHRFAAMNAVPLAAVDGEIYLSRVNCEQADRINGHLAACGAAVTIAYESEREDWILNMVAGGLGIAFVPEFSATIPGLTTRPVIEPEIWRDIALVTRPDRAATAALEAFVAAVTAYPWPEGRFASV